MTKSEVSRKVVFVVGGDLETEEMFESEGWVCTSQNGLFLETYGPTLVCFTGGADINPAVYGEEPNGAKDWDDERDTEEIRIYNQYAKKIPVIGICRGGQLLNVLNGGNLHQHLGRTVRGDIEVEINTGGKMSTLVLRVDHHQGIVATREAVTSFNNGEILWAGIRLDDVELAADYVVWYPETRCLCFQPHPEWGHEETKILFFNLMKEYLDV